MSAKLYLTFAALTGEDPHEFEWVVRDNDLTHRWLREMADALENPFKIREQRFNGWAYKQEDLEVLAAKINHCITSINDYYGKRYKIEEYAFYGMGQEILNALHHHFEILIGQSWKPSVYFEGIPDHVHIAIRKLNDHVHDFEHGLRAKANEENGGYCFPKKFTVRLAHPHLKEFSEEDFLQFSYASELGDIVTDYCQLGKTWTDVFVDKDKHIFAENISPLRFYSSSFNCLFYQFSTAQSDYMANEVRCFIRNHSFNRDGRINPENPRNALGHIVYASLGKGSPLSQWGDSERNGFMRSHSNITKIRLVSGATSIEREFSDPETYASPRSFLLEAFNRL